MIKEIRETIEFTFNQLRNLTGMSFEYNTIFKKTSLTILTDVLREYKLYGPTFNPFTVSCHSELLTVHRMKFSQCKSLSSTTMIFIVSHRFIARSTSTINDTNQSPSLPRRKKSTCIALFVTVLTQIPDTDVVRSGAI